ncbi:MAG: bifunctional alpha,alpha-trehalose-phosphate synthase (UDP-forming)/trehalose-phosphatase [Ardenticatenaceae bacterium]|nr:bifunctional alpha,alpha-trehalose-phosphate synthase (UDP-forming)/trehalose-phosphatase [Ardenticatenaceae bacterium]HBY99501.1 bifunctional alpha,alpha-trehalose-phosphate synthase (UDP-forming)/trehalose-phosphatase [Chloroflexota bacterium]
MLARNPSTRRLLIVSNRLPVTVVEKEGNLKFRRSAGGLASGINAYLDSLKKASGTTTDYVWVGWPGITIDDPVLRDDLRSRLSKDHTYPVFLDEEDVDNFYHGFCNEIIWPLFHYFPSYGVYNKEYWLSYKKVNELFRDVITDIMQPDDIVWIHDYHLMLLPRLVREAAPNIPIGFFLHTPFPSYEIFRLLPSKWRKEILEGLLSADLSGYHTHGYTQYFLRCVLRILGYNHHMGQIIVRDRIVKARAFPLGIDFQRFRDTINDPRTKKKRDEFQKELTGLKIVLSVDRLDYTKGIINRLQGYELFLKENPEWRENVTLLLIVVPSRTGVEQYAQMKKQIEEVVGRLNGRFGNIGWTPIMYQYRSLSFHSLVALYSMSDVALVTPLRDGMNLVAKEYVASRRDQTGVLILSEMAGASKELGEAILINPNSEEEIADAIKQALIMPEEAQKTRNRAMQRRLQRYDVVRWAEDFINELLATKESQMDLIAKILDARARNQLLEDFKKARKRLLLLDYDGTLVPFARTPEEAIPAERLLAILKRLAASPQNEVVLISGRDRKTLENWFGPLQVRLVAEHGAWMKGEDGEWYMPRPLSAEWKPGVRPLLDMYADRLPRSFVEEKQFSLVWHYRAADPELGPARAKELVDSLVDFTANIDVQILQGNKVVEVRSGGVDKGSTALYWLSQEGFAFIFAVGDDWTDEDLFEVLPGTAYSIKVGISRSRARFYLNDYRQVLQLLKQLAELSEV